MSDQVSTLSVSNYLKCCFFPVCLEFLLIYCALLTPKTFLRRNSRSNTVVGWERDVIQITSSNTSSLYKNELHKSTTTWIFHEAILKHYFFFFSQKPLMTNLVLSFFTSLPHCLASLRSPRPSHLQTTLPALIHPHSLTSNINMALIFSFLLMFVCYSVSFPLLLSLPLCASASPSAPLPL